MMELLSNHPAFGRVNVLPCQESGYCIPLTMQARFLLPSQQDRHHPRRYWPPFLLYPSRPLGLGMHSCSCTFERGDARFISPQGKWEYKYFLCLSSAHV